MDDLAFALEQVLAASGPLIRLEPGPDGRPVAAVAAVRVAAPPERVWSVVQDVARYPERVPMIQKVKLEGDRVAIHLGFRVALFSAGFHFVADTVRHAPRRFELRYVSGEPRAIDIRFDLIPSPDGTATALYTRVAFDIYSLGWLVKFFLKNHPEIQYGVFPGTSSALLDSVRRAVEAGG